MLIQRRRAFSALVTSLFLLAGCGTASLSPTAPTKLPALGLDRQADLSELGSLEVALESAEAARKVLSTVSDVASYRISVQGASGTTPQVKTCAAPTGNARKVSSLFSQLNPGEYTVTVETLDAGGNVIGFATSTATVKKGICTVVTLRVKLDPTSVKNSQGNLDVHVIVENGDVIEKPIEACKPADGFTPLDGACTPSPTPTPSESPWSSSGNALYLQGQGKYAKAAGSQDDQFTELRSNFTYEFWVLPTQVEDMNPDIRYQHYVVFPGRGFGTLAGAGVAVGTNGIKVVEHAPDYIPNVLIHQAELNGWTHVALVYADNTPTLYVNGELAATGPRSARTVVASSTFGNGGIGQYGNFEGGFDEMRIWSYARTQAEIQSDMNRGITGSEPNLFAAWNFSELTGPLSLDLSPNGHDLTITSERTNRPE